MATWLPVPGWEGSYEVSDCGQVRSVTRSYIDRVGSRRTFIGRVLAQPRNHSGYAIVTLSHRGQRVARQVHALVALAFIGPRPDGLQTCHNDGNQLNNAVTNLRYDTAAGNVQDQFLHGTHPRANKTHCPAGHEYAPGNTYIQPTGGRVCRTCKRIRDRARYAAKKVAA